MGAIYQCFDTNLNIPMAVKENFLTGPQSVKQFQQEALILARLHHPNLPRVIDHFELEGRHYLVMDYIAGQDLWNMVQQRKLPLEESQALDYILQVCEAVIYLHRQKPPIIHRDIKPQNVKITPNGRAVLVDFGIAKVADFGSHTNTGAQGVTPGFSPPAEYSGEGPSPASDLFSLGATLYASLTGKKPPNSVSLLVDPTKFKPPSAYNAKITPQISQAIMHAMQPEISRRPPSVAAWKQELEAILNAAAPIAGKEAKETTAVKPLPATLWLIGPRGQAFHLKPGSHTLGRGSDCHFLIPDARASRHHATIVFDGKSCLIYDSHSANGTFVNNQPVTERGYALKLGDNFQIGDSVFKLSAVNESRPQPLAPAVPHVDEMAGTLFIPDLPDPELTNAPALALPDSGPTDSRRQSQSHSWLWLIMGLVIIFLLAVIFWAIFTLRNRPPVNPRPTATPVAALLPSPTANIAEATLIALAATATAQTAAGVAPNVDTAATIAAAVAATEQAMPTPTPSRRPNPPIPCPRPPLPLRPPPPLRRSQPPLRSPRRPPKRQSPAPPLSPPPPRRLSGF
jgi:serine/threonine protein kinase